MNANHGLNRPRRVLLIEGDAADAGRLLALLRGAFGTTCEVSHVTRLTDGVDALAAGWFDVALLDLLLPDGQGPESVGRLGAACAETPILAISGWSDDAVELESIRLGAQDTLRKDELDASTLGRAIRHALERQRVVNRLNRNSRTKTQFVSTAAHELRTPLAVIRGYVEAVRDDLLGAIGEKPRQWLTSALSGCDGLSELIETILDFGQIERGQLNVRARRLECLPMLRSCYEDFSKPCRELGLDLTLDCDATLPPVLGDETRLRQVLVNLIGNATKFTPPGGRIGIRAERVGDAVCVSVADTGIGIPREHQRAVFEEFKKLDHGPGSASSGAGLGLAITKHIIERHHGRIAVESDDGAGSRFWFEVPTYDADREFDTFVEDKRRTFGTDRNCLLHVRGDGARLTRLANAARTHLRKGDDALLVQPEHGRAVIAFDCPRAIIHRPLERLFQAIGPDEYAALGFALEPASATGPAGDRRVLPSGSESGVPWLES